MFRAAQTGALHQAYLGHLSDVYSVTVRSSAWVFLDSRWEFRKSLPRRITISRIALRFLLLELLSLEISFFK